VFWTVAGPVIGCIGLIAGAIVGTVRWLRARRILTCQLAEVVPVLDRARFGPHASVPTLTVSHKGHKLDNPHLVHVRLTNRSYHDIPSAAFDQDRPLIIDLGSPITALLDITYQPPDRLFPAAVAHGSVLEVGPGKIRSRSTVTFYLLTDGGVKRLKWENPLIDIAVRAVQPQTDSVPGISAKKVLGWTAALFIAFYLVTNPRGAAQAVTSLVDALKQAGNSLATFFNSL
jgi:hypothetical protein